ncbi:MAG: TPM domain-containing protein [Verrucomicrobiota bacterium]
MKQLCAILILVLLGCRLFADEVIPPPPSAYFNDYANVVSTATASQLNQTLENFERQTSEQIVVAIFPKMESDSSVDDYTVRVARSWQVGQKDKNNGAVLFVFVQDHRMFIQVGYGLEGVLPDAICKRIIDEQIAPRFKAGDYDGGLTAGVQSILAATKGEYKGNGETQGDRHHSHVGSLIIPILIVIFVILPILTGGRSGLGPWILLSAMGSSSNWGRGGGGGGGFSGGGGGGGGFSGGGGSFGGGGAGGSW